jgi:hypothetical protein
MATELARSLLSRFGGKVRLNSRIASAFGRPAERVRLGGEMPQATSANLRICNAGGHGRPSGLLKAG